MSSEQSHREVASHRDGVPTCAVCEHRASNDLWCPLVGALVCAACCTRVRNLEPSSFVRALSRAEVSLSPTEVVRACGSCKGNRVKATVGDIEDGSLPS